MGNRDRLKALGATESGPKPGEFPLGSEKSRAAARAVLSAREAESADDQTVFVFCQVGHPLALDGDTCVDILRESGHLRGGSGIGFVDLCGIPDGLNAEELE